MLKYIRVYAVYMILQFLLCTAHVCTAIHDKKTSFTGQKMFILISTILTWTRTKPLNAVSNYGSINSNNLFAFLLCLCTWLQVSIWILQLQILYSAHVSCIVREYMLCVVQIGWTWRTIYWGRVSTTTATSTFQRPHRCWETSDKTWQDSELSSTFNKSYQYTSILLVNFIISSSLHYQEVR